ncbi:methyl-accepting chemotaxis protein [Metabacillus sp. B2-18]|uniref:methyl-accepting chemotaxis protein n=1 Tax=Metabacillus sp. B2-18 TaxID=2897333 RepID=UPI001E34F0B1|nr:methyl-accepting chemotaxis protein [Metabacillus sp. B2-18]UGB30547.1 methyl-accepting chemotaxis protein [Metabacillus sp. B2-18]
MNLKFLNSIRTKLLLFSLLLLIIPSAVIGFTSYTKTVDELDAAGQAQLKNNVQLVLEMIDLLNSEVEQGTMTLEEAQDKVKTVILGEKGADGTRPINKDIDVGEHGYMFVISDDGSLIAHPSKEGENIWDSEDPNGTKVGKLVVEQALNGNGFSTYDWALPDNPDKVEPKITYAEQDSHWGWIVSAGTYTMDFNQGANSVLMNLLITLGASIVIGVIVVSVFSGVMAKPVIAITESSKSVANGDLTVEPLPFKSKDEIGELAENFNRMVDSLKGLIKQVGDSAEKVAASSEELTAGSDLTKKATEQISTSIQEVAIGSEKQVSSTSQANTTVAEISEGMSQVTKSIQEVVKLTVQTNKSANNGSNVVTQTIAQMKMMQDKVKTTSNVVNSLGEKTKEINEIVYFITELANQTNLLALNAAIEAARAGEQGKGFAIVADEVRKLAEQSGQAAGKIQTSMSLIQSEATQAVLSMNEGTAVVEEGIKMVHQTGETFHGIAELIEQVTSQTQEVSTIVEEVNSRSQNVVGIVEEVAHISEQSSSNTQQVAAAAEEQSASMDEIAGSAESLSKMAQELQGVIQKFRL